MNADFAHLHLHTQYSLLDGAIRLDDLFKAAHQDGMSHVAMTDHGNLFGAVDFFLRAKEYGIEPIIGCEVYLAPGSRLMKATHTSLDDELPPYATCRSGVYHLVLLCMNGVGYQNLCQIVSAGYLEGFYYKPRVDKEILAKYSEGLIVTSACLKGELTHLAMIGDMDRATKTAEWYTDTFGGRFYLEIQQNGLPEQMVVNQRFQELSAKLKLPLIATADCHYMKKEDAISQEVLMRIQSGKVLEDPNDIQVKSDEFYFKPQSVMKEEFAFCPQAIANTMEVARSCRFEFKFTNAQGKKIYHFPRFEPPPGKTLEQMLCDDAREGLGKRLMELQEQRAHSELEDQLDTPHSELEEELQRPFSDAENRSYTDRLERELAVINDMGFAGYFLIVSDFIAYAKQNAIPVGPGRGSGAGSLVAYALGITELDPIEHGLLFERFLNPERVSLTDFDIDFCMEKRDRMIEYVTRKYGDECVAQIVTYGKLQARGVIRDVGRVFGMDIAEVNKIAKGVPETLGITLGRALEQDARLRTLVEKDPRISRLIAVCRSLEGLYRHASIHASGVVISNRPMVEHCPLTRGKNGERVIQYDMIHAEKIGLVKFDFLGLKTLTFLDRACDLIRCRYPGSHINLMKLNLKDKRVYELLSSGDTLGVFQLESSGMQDLLRRARPDCFADIVAINALYRPGPIGSGMLDDFIGRKHGEVPIQYDFEELQPILQETYGVIIYQEQVQQIAIRLARYTAGGADLLRRAMGKKRPEEMHTQKQVFVEGATKNGFDRVKIERCFDLMAQFAGYGFNKSHAAAYSLIAFQTAYLKARRPVEFFAALLSTEMGVTDKITRYIKDAKRHDIAVLPPNINESDTDFTVLSENQIRFGLGAIKGVGQIAIDSVLKARLGKGRFTDLYDLASRVNPRTVNKRVLEAFVKAGALDEFRVNRATLFAAIDDALELGSTIQKMQDDKQPSFSELFDTDDPSFSPRKISYPEKPPWTRLQELKFEKETIGFFVSGHPLDDFERELGLYTTQTISDCRKETSSKTIWVGVEVGMLREILTKHGDRMAFAMLEDTSDQMEAVIFSDLYLDSEADLKSGEPIWVRGQLEVGEQGNKIILSKKNQGKILPLRHAYEAVAREIHVHMPVGRKEASEIVFSSLRSFLGTVYDKQGVPLFLHLDVPGQAKVILKMKETVPLKREVIGQLQTILAREATHVEFR